MVNETQMVIQNLSALLKLGFHKDQTYAANQLIC